MSELDLGPKRSPFPVSIDENIEASKEKLFAQS